MDRETFLRTSGPPRPIAEADVAELYRPARRGPRQTRQRGGLGPRVEDVAHALDRDLHLLEVLPDLGEPENRLRRLGGDHVEGDQRTDAELAVDHRLGAEQEERGGGELADILDCELAPRAEEGSGEACLHIGRKLLLSCAMASSRA
jgi:hypothetical protein